MLTDAFYALEAMDGKDKAIILDACKGNNAPGTLYRFICDPLHGKWNPAFRISMHQMNFMDVIIASEAFKLPHEIVLLGVEPEMIDWSSSTSIFTNHVMKPPDVAYAHCGACLQG